MSLVMGVAGIAVSKNTILLTGIAGLMAGSISMALGEWLSVQSSRELNQRQIDLETEELEASPDDEKKGIGFIVSGQRNECGRGTKTCR